MKFFNKNNVRVWAYANAYTLCFITIMFIVTWVFIFARGV